MWCCSGSLEKSLKDGLQKFSNGRRYEYWSQYVKSLVCHVAQTEEEGLCSFPETQMLISAWRMLLILSTVHVCRIKPEMLEVVRTRNSAAIMLCVFLVFSLM